MFLDRVADSEEPSIDTVEAMREFIYKNTTKTIYNFVGDHSIGNTKVSGVQMSG